MKNSEGLREKVKTLIETAAETKDKAWTCEYFEI